MNAGPEGLDLFGEDPFEGEPLSQLLGLGPAEETSLSWEEARQEAFESTEMEGRYGREMTEYDRQLCEGFLSDQANMVRLESNVGRSTGFKHRLLDKPAAFPLLKAQTLNA